MEALEQLDVTAKVKRVGIPDRFIYSASRLRQMAMCGLDATGIAEKVRSLHETEALAG